MRVQRERGGGGGGGGGGATSIGRVSASALLPPGARLLVPKSALEGRRSGDGAAGPVSAPVQQRREQGEGDGGAGTEEEAFPDDGGDGGGDDPATLALARRLRRRLLFAGPGFCVLDKPSGVHSQGGSRREARGATLDAAAAAAARRGWLGSGMAPPPRKSSESSPAPGWSSSSPALAARLVHRLDAPVSGAIAVAGSADAAARLARAFAAPSSSLLLAAASSEGEGEGEGEGEEEREGGGAGGRGGEETEGGERGGARRRRARRKLSSFLSPPPPSSPPSSSPSPFPFPSPEIEISKTYLAIVDCVPYGTLLSLSSPPPPPPAAEGGAEDGEGGGGARRRAPGGGPRRRGVLDGPLPLSPVAGGAALRAVAIARASAGSAAPPAQAPRAATRWRLLAADGEAGWALLALSPLTGRRHQLRKHCAGSFGSPVAGDERYGATRSPRGRMVAAVAEAARRRRGRGEGKGEGEGKGRGEGKGKGRGNARGRTAAAAAEDAERDQEEEESSSAPPPPSCSSPNLMLYCASLTLRAPEGGVTVRARPPPHFEALARRLGWGPLVAARGRAAERAPATAAGEWRRGGAGGGRSDSDPGSSSGFATKAPLRWPRRAPRAGRRPDWAL